MTTARLDASDIAPTVEDGRACEVISFADACRMIALRKLQEVNRRRSSKPRGPHQPRGAA
jgi:hypothetical protein